MEPLDRNRLEALFGIAIALPPELRSRYLDRILGEDATLRYTLDSLLRPSDAATSFFDRLNGLVVQAVLTASQMGEAHPRSVSHFRILEPLGEGGMGVVYKAHDNRLGRLVALKFLHPHLRCNADARARFVREAQSASVLDHPNIATIHEICTDNVNGDDLPGGPFIVMTYYSGETVKRKLEDGPLPLRDSLAVAIQTCRGLAKAHAHGICHRDVKPANLIVTRDGIVKILDFGLARVAGTTLTRPGSRMGSASYMSPEQLRGEDVDHRTDVWSLGVVLYEMVTGRRPFQGDYELGVIHSILNAEPPPLGSLREDVPPGLEAVVHRCLRKDPSSRHETALALARELREVLLRLNRKTCGRPPRNADATQTRRKAFLATEGRSRRLFGPGR